MVQRGKFLPCKHENHIWFPGTHLSARWAWRPTCNPNACKATWESSDDLASQVTRIYELQVQQEMLTAKINKMESDWGHLTLSFGSHMPRANV